MEFVITGMICSISETKFTKDGNKYKKIVVKEGGIFWTMFIFDDSTKLSNVKEKDVVRIKGTIIKNLKEKKEFFKISKIKILSKEKEEEFEEEEDLIGDEFDERIIRKMKWKGNEKEND